MKGKKLKSTKLTQKILCTILAASVFGVCGNVSAADPYVVSSDREITGTELTGQDVIVLGEIQKSGYDLTVTGPYSIGKLEISGESAVKLNAAGSINDIYMHSGDELSLTANNADINGYVRITGGVAELTGGSIVSGGTYEIGQGKYLQQDIRVNESSGLITDHVNITGDVMAEDDGSFVEINGGTVTETEYYEVEGDHSEDRHIAVDSEGNFIVDGYTEVHAELGGKVTVTDAVLNTGVSAFGNDSIVEVNNSSISTQGSIFAAAGGKIYLNGNADTVYSLGGENVFAALNTSADGESGDGLIEINGGTLEAENLRYLVGIGTDENGNKNPFLDGSYQDEPIELTVVKGGIVLKENGVIETKGDQIFERGVDVSSDEAVLNSTSGAVTNDAISYVGGTLKLTDEKYSLGYVSSAKDALIDWQSDSATKIVMTGTLVTDSGNNEMDVDDAASIGDDVELDKVTVNAEKNLLVGSTMASGDIDGVEVVDTVANGFSAGKLNLAEGSTGMVITNAENVTLGGSAGGELITVDGEAADVKVVVGTTDDVDGADVKNRFLNYRQRIGYQRYSI